MHLFSVMENQVVAQKIMGTQYLIHQFELSDVSPIFPIFKKTPHG
jgi:hypothetical protein